MSEINYEVTFEKISEALNMQLDVNDRLIARISKLEESQCCTYPQLCDLLAELERHNRIDTKGSMLIYKNTLEKILSKYFT